MLQFQHDAQNKARHLSGKRLLYQEQRLGTEFLVSTKLQQLCYENSSLMEIF
jgi:hypothetical protein